MKFDLDFPSIRIDSFDEGVEFGFRNLNSNREWIPLVFYTAKSNHDDEIKIGEAIDSIILRGYNVSFNEILSYSSIQLKMCGPEIIQSDAVLNFRWLQTVVTPAAANNDAAELDNVMIKLVYPKQNCYTLFMEDFNNQDAIK